MAKQVWAEGDVLYATGATGLNENVLQFIDSDSTYDSLGTTNEEIFTNKQITVPASIKKRILVMAYLQSSHGSFGSGNTTYRIRMGTAGTTADAQVATLTPVFGSDWDVNNQSYGTGGIMFFYYDDTTDFSGGDQILSITGHKAHASNGGHCAWILLLGA